MFIRRYEDGIAGLLLRPLGRTWANSRLGIIHQARLPSHHVLFLPLQHDSGIDKGRIALTQREGTSEHAGRRLVVAAGHLNWHQCGRVLPGPHTIASSWKQDR